MGPEECVETEGKHVDIRECHVPCGPLRDVSRRNTNENCLLNEQNGVPIPAGKGEALIQNPIILAKLIDLLKVNRQVREESQEISPFPQSPHILIMVGVTTLEELLMML